MRHIFFFLSFSIIYGSILPVKGQCTLSACTDISRGSHGCSTEAQEEYYQNVQVMLGEMSFNIKRIGVRVEDADEGERKLAKEQYHDLLNVCQNLSAKIDALGETASDIDIDKDLEQMYKNLSLRLEIIDEKFQDMLSVTASIQSRIANAEESIKGRIQSHDLSLERLDQNISTEVDRIDGRLQSLVQQVGEIYQLLQKTVCPDGFDYVPEINQCLYLNLTLMTWDNARTACARYKTGAQLTSIKDSVKQEAVRRYLEHQFTKQESAVCISSRWTYGGKITWMVGQTRNPTQCGSPFVWKPVGAAEIPFNYTNWWTRQPDCKGGHQHCAIICSAPQIDYRWDDCACDLMLCSLCEF